MSYFNKCPDCGAHLDPGEKCDCEKENAPAAGTAETQEKPKPSKSYCNINTAATALSIERNLI